MAFLETESKAQIIIFCITGCLSILGCLTYLYCFAFVQKVRSYARKILAFIALTEAIMIVGNVSGMIYMSTTAGYDIYHNRTITMSNSSNDCTVNMTTLSPQFCQIQGFFTNFFAIASFLFNASLAVILLQMTLTNRSSKTVFFFLNCTCWIVPLVVTIATANQGLYGYSVCTTGGWCWINRQNQTNVFWVTFSGKFWEFGTEAVMLVSYISMMCAVVFKKYQAKKHGLRSDVMQTVATVESLYKRMFASCLFFAICYLFGTIRSYVLLYDKNYSRDETFLNFLSFMHGFGNNAPGIFNVLLFVVCQEKMRTDLMRNLREHFRRFTKQNQVFNVNNTDNRRSHHSSEADSRNSTANPRANGTSPHQLSKSISKSINEGTMRGGSLHSDAISDDSSSESEISNSICSSESGQSYFENYRQ